MIRKLTDPSWDEMEDEVESEIDATKDTFEDAFAYDTVSGAVQPRSLPRPLNTERYRIGGPFAAGVHPFFHGHWRRGRQVMERSQAELRETDESMARSSTETPTTTSQMPTAITTPTSSTASTSTTTAVPTTTPSVNNLIEQLLQALANQTPTPESTASSPATTTAIPMTTPSPNNFIEHVVQVLVNQIPTPESTASSIQQLIQLLQPQFNPTTPEPETTTAQAAATTDKPDYLTDVIIEAIASLGLDIQNVRIIGSWFKVPYNPTTFRKSL